MSRTSQQGYVLFTVVVMLFIVAATVYLVSYDSSFMSSQPARELDAARADYVAEAALQHALWQNSNNACAGGFSIPTTALGPDSYSVSTTGGGTASAVSLSVDQDAWIRSDNVGENNGTGQGIHVNFTAGNTEQALYRFDLSSLAPGAQINSAVAWFYLRAAQSHPEGHITVHRITEDWTELGATWDTMNGNFESALLATIPAQEVGAVWVQVNLTAQVQAWVNGMLNFGILFNTQAEGLHTDYSAREEGANPPRLDVTVGTSPVSSLNIQATGTLANGVTRTLNRQAVPAYQPPSNSVLQPDPALNDTYTSSSGPAANHGSDSSLEVGDAGSVRYTLMKFDLGAIPVGARIVSAELSLNLESVVSAPAGAVITAHRMLEPWTEDDATYLKSDGNTSWDWPEGFDSTGSMIPVPFESPSPGWVSWDIRPLVAGWVNNASPNYGLALAGANGVNNARFTSSDSALAALRPRLSVSYACDCATACMPPQGSGAILLVVNNELALTPYEQSLQANFESWGYTVSAISANANEATFVSQASIHDVIYVSETTNSNQVDAIIVDLSLGIVSEQGDINDALGFASAKANPVGSSISVLNSSHEITLPFSSGAVEIYAASMEGLTVSGSEAPGLQTLADWDSAGSLVVLDQGAQGTSGVAAGRRVMLPLGRSTTSNLNWNFLSQNGRLLVQRSIEWAIGPKAPPGATSLLLVVDDSLYFTQQDRIKKIMFESWGFSVTVINDDDSQGEFDARMAAADVVFVTKDATASDVGTKLTGAVIGVVTEEADLSDEIGFSVGVEWEAGIQNLNIDNNYFVTSPLSAGQVTVLSTSGNIASLTGFIAPEIRILGSSNVGPALVTLETGALSTIGAAAGRRVLLPWGSDSMDVNHLNADGLTVFQRALDWAADFGVTATSPYILSTATDATLGGLSFTDTDLATYKPWSDTASLFFDGSLTTLSADIDAVHVLGNGHLVLSSSANTTLGGVSFENGDLVDYDVATNTSILIFDGSARFTDPTENIISVHVLANRHFVISTDSNATLGGLSFTDRDLVEYDAVTDTASLFFDGSLTTLSQDITAVQVLSNGHIVLSPNGITTLGGLIFADGDLVDYDPLADTAELIFDGSALFSVAEKVMSVHIGPGSGSVGSCDGTFRDEFNVTSFAGNNGTLAWAGPWLEVGESDGATAGDILVATDASNYQLRTRDNDNGGEGVEREADLGGAVSAVLSYDYRRWSLAANNDYTSVDVSAHGGAGPWTELARYKGPGTDTSYQPASHDISGFISANTRIRFKTSPTMGNNDVVWFDNIQILCSP